MFRFINFMILVIATIIFACGAFWYVTTPQPARMKDQMTFAMDTAIFQVERFKQGGDDNILTWRDLARAGNSAAELHHARLLFQEARKSPMAYNEAMTVLDRLATKGIPEGQNAYAVMLRDGLGVKEPNKIEAYKWFSLAAARGSKLAEKNLLDLSHQMTAIDINDAEHRASEWMLDYLREEKAL